MIHLAARDLGGPHVHAFPDAAPKVSAGATAHGAPAVLLTGGHERRTAGLLFTDRAHVAALRDNLTEALEGWPT